MTPVKLTIAAILMVFACQSAQAQGLVFGTSDPAISIHSSFSGQTVTFFGNVEPSEDGALPSGSYDIVVVVRGPVEERVVRRKARQFGLMLNADHALFAGLPSFYRVLSSRPLDTILDEETIDSRNLSLEQLAANALSETSGDAERFEEELVRLMTRANLYRADPRGVTFLSPTFFSARTVLPANVPNGIFLAQVFVVQDGQIVAERAQRFFVQKSGFERFLGEAAVSQPLLYGLATVFLALFTGWMGGVLFRR